MFLKLTFFLVFLTLVESNASAHDYSRLIERIKRSQVNNKQQTFTNNNFNPGNNFNNNGSPGGNGGMTFTNNNFGPGVNNNGPPPMMGGGNTFTNNNFGMAGMNIMNNNGNGHPPSAPNMFVNNNNGMAGAGMSMGMSMNNVMYGMLSDNGDGTYIQPIFVNSEKGKKLIGYNIIANNKIIHTVFNQIVPGSDPAPLTAGPIPGPPGPPGPPGEEKKIKI